MRATAPVFARRGLEEVQHGDVRRSRLVREHGLGDVTTRRRIQLDPAVCDQAHQCGGFVTEPNTYSVSGSTGSGFSTCHAVARADFPTADPHPYGNPGNATLRGRRLDEI